MIITPYFEFILEQNVGREADFAQALWDTPMDTNWSSSDPFAS